MPLYQFRRDLGACDISRNNPPMGNHKPQVKHCVMKDLASTYVLDETTQSLWSVIADLNNDVTYVGGIALPGADAVATAV